MPSAYRISSFVGQGCSSFLFGASRHTSLWPSTSCQSCVRPYSLHTFTACNRHVAPCHSEEGPKPHQLHRCLCHVYMPPHQLYHCPSHVSPGYLRISFRFAIGPWHLVSLNMTSCHTSLMAVHVMFMSCLVMPLLGVHRSPSIVCRRPTGLYFECVVRIGATMIMPLPVRLTAKLSVRL